MTPASTETLYLLSFGLLCLLARCEPVFKPILPPSYPLAVKNPYLSAWLPGNQTVDLPTAVAEFGNGQQLTWSVMARINDTTHSLFGMPDPPTGTTAGSLLSAEYTSAHTTFIVDVESMQFVLDFFSPISAGNYVRQSLPFSFLTVSVSGINEATADVQIYSDIDNSWAGLFGEDVETNWGYSLISESTQIFTLAAGANAEFSEVNDMAQWGTAVYCTKPSSSNISSTVGDRREVRDAFAANGSLSDNWSWDVGSVVAFSHKLGTVSSTHNITFAIGYVRDADVNYMGSRRAGYWRSAVPDINAACVRALVDFTDADVESRSLDAQLSELAISAAGNQYSDIVTLSVRQAFGAMDLTIPQESLDVEDIMAFLKESSSNGNVNTIDVIMPMSPILYVLAPEYIRLLLEPVMQYLESGEWNHNYTIHDIGSHYPNATGHNDDTAEEMPVEECGNLLILAYMYQLASGNSEWATQYSSLFEQYAE